MSDDNNGGEDRHEIDADRLLHEAAGRLTLLERRRIEAAVLVPLIRAFQKEFGEERTNAVARGVIVALAEQQGREQGAMLGRNDMPGLAQTMQAFSGSGALDIEMVERDDTRIGYDVRRCRFAEMYRGIGAGDLGFLLSCNRDFSFVGGFNRAIELRRTQTIMQGGEFCDFRYRAEESDPPAGG